MNFIRSMDIKVLHEFVSMIKVNDLYNFYAVSLFGFPMKLQVMGDG